MDRKIIPYQFKELLDYDPDTGDAWWKVNYASRKAGTLCRNPNAEGYFRVNFKAQGYFLHRVIWFLHYGEQPPHLIDHINHDNQCNAISNLRELSPEGNNRNRVRGTGVVFNPSRRGGVWFANWGHQHIYEGRDKLEAYCRRFSAENKYWHQ